MWIEKLLTQLASPLGLACWLGVLAWLLYLTAKRRCAWLLSGLALAWLWMCSLPVVSTALQHQLEQLHPVQPLEQLPTAEAIIVLGGGLQPSLPPAAPYPDLGSAADRVWHAARLYHAQKAPLILASGGGVSWTIGDAREADAMAEFLQALGVPSHVVVRERQSANTYQNATFSQELLRAQGIKHVLLVTSAWHMPRAYALFSHTGLQVTAASIDAEGLQHTESSVLDWLPDARALEHSSRALKEYLGFWICQWRDQC